MGNRTAVLLLALLIALLVVAATLLPALHVHRPVARAAPLVQFIENEYPAGARLFTEFEGKLRARLRGAPMPRLEFVPISDPALASTRERYRGLLERKPVAVLAMSGGAAVPIAQIAPSLPMVFFTNADPVVTGLVSDYNHPGGSRTGITVALDTIGKRIEILKEAVPRAKRIGVLVDAGTRLSDLAPDLATFERMGVTVVAREAANSPEGVRAAIAADPSIDAWYIPYNGASYFNVEAVLDAIARARRPAIFERAKFADGGGLLAYQHTVEDPLGRMAEMLASILEGVNPGDIPVVRPQRFELVVNLAAARRLGITLPKGLVKRADRVIDE